MSWEADIRMAHTQMTAILRTLETARTELANDARGCRQGKIRAAVVPEVATGWKKWTQDVNSFVQGKTAEIGVSSDIATAVLATSVHNDPDRRVVFNPDLGLPALNQEHKVISAPTRTKASDVQSMLVDAVGQLEKPERSSTGDYQQAVVTVLNGENTWPCSYQYEVNRVRAAVDLARDRAGNWNTKAAVNAELAKQLQQKAAGRRPDGMPSGGSIIVKSMYWQMFFRISPGKVLCSRESPE